MKNIDPNKRSCHPHTNLATGGIRYARVVVPSPGPKIAMLFASALIMFSTARPTHAAGSHPPPNTGQRVCHDNP